MAVNGKPMLAAGGIAGRTARGINAFSGSLGVPGVHGARYVSVEALKPQDSYVRVPRQEDCTHRS
eukprot:jgi/Pico_ML_1/53421/g412.t1